MLPRRSVAAKVGEEGGHTGKSMPSAFGTAMAVSKWDAIPSAETFYWLLFNGWNLLATNGEMDFFNLSVHDGETAAFLGLGFHTAIEIGLVNSFLPT